MHSRWLKCIAASPVRPRGLRIENGRFIPRAKGCLSRGTCSATPALGARSSPQWVDKLAHFLAYAVTQIRCWQPLLIFFYFTSGLLLRTTRALLSVSSRRIGNCCGDIPTRPSFRAAMGTVIEKYVAISDTFFRCSCVLVTPVPDSTCMFYVPPKSFEHALCFAIKTSVHQFQLLVAHAFKYEPLPQPNQALSCIMAEHLGYTDWKPRLAQ